MTDDRLITEELRYLRQMADAIDAVFWLADAIAPRILYVSPAYDRIWGRDRQQLYSHYPKFFESIHPEDRERVQAAASRCVAQERFEVEYRIVRPNGEVRWVRDRGFLIRDQAGAPDRLAGFAEDITESKQAEQTLRQSEAQLQAVAANLPNGAVFVVDRELRYQLAEGAAIKLAGMTSEDLVGKTIWEALDPALAAEYEPFYRQALRGEPFNLEHHSHDRHYISHGTPLVNDQGEIYAVLAVSYDISDRKRIEAERQQTENALQQAYTELELQAKQLEVVNQDLQVTLQSLHIHQEELRAQNEELTLARQATEAERQRYQDLFNFAPDGYVVTDADGLIQEANQMITALLSYDSMAQMPRPLSVYVAESDHRVFRNFLSKLPKHNHPQSCELNLKPFRGSPFRAAITAATIRNDQEQILGIRWLIRDITGRKRVEAEHQQAEAALRQSESRFRFMVESAKDYAIFTIDLNGIVTGWNAGAERLLGYLEAEIIGRDGRIIFTSEDRDQRRPELEMQLALTQGRAENERWHVCKDGSRFWGSGLVSPLQDEAGTTQGFVKILQDKTLQRQSQAEREQLLQQEQAARVEAERANRIKDEFLAVLSHELRSPLNPILGWSKLLQNGRLSETRQRKALATIERNAQLQSQLIEDLLDISRIMQGKLTLAAAPVNLKAVIAAAVETVRLAAQAKNIEITLDLDATIAPISGDATRLQQVVWNLLTNAVKFTPADGQVTVELRQLDQLAQIRVIDTGKGIDPQFLPYVFEYFRQEDGSTTRKFGGLGLGLAIVRQIVEMHGGKVGVASQGENQGATFIVRLPVPQQTIATAAERSPNLPESPETPLSNLHILVVDDDDDTREFQAFMLEQSGAKVTAVASAREALQLLNQSIPDVLVSDIGMAEIDGYMLIQQIRSRPSGQGGTIPAIALTAYAGDFDQQQALQAGFQQHVSKPVEPEVLVSTIISLLRKVRVSRL